MKYVEEGFFGEPEDVIEQIRKHLETNRVYPESFIRLEVYPCPDFSTKIKVTIRHTEGKMSSNYCGIVYILVVGVRELAERRTSELNKKDLVILAEQTVLMSTGFFLWIAITHPQ